MIKNYLITALRNLSKNKTFAAINITGLALGISCGLAIFMIVRYELSFDKFHPNHKRIYRIVGEFDYAKGNQYQPGVPLPLPAAFKLDFPEAEQVASIYGGYNNQVDVLDNKGNNIGKRFIEGTGVFYTDPAFFKTFNFKWLFGDPASVLVKPNMVALTTEIAEKYFGSWQNAIGQLIRKDNSELLQVAGILETPPANTDFPLKMIISYPTFVNSAYYKQLNAWENVNGRSQCYVLLPDDLHAASINARFSAFIKKHTSIKNTTEHYSLQPLADIHFNETYTNFNRRTISKPTLWSLALIGVFLLLLACINFINLATAQAVKRSKEVGIRKVLGGQRWQLILQFLGEAFVIIVCATILAIGLVSALAPFATSILNHPVPLSPLQSPAAILFTLLVVIVVTLFSGFYPAIIISGFRPGKALKNKIAQRMSGGISMRRLLIILQFGIAQVLIIGTIIVVSQVNFFRNASLGFNKDAIVTVTLPYDSISQEKWQTFREQLLQQPGIEHVSFSYTPPTGKGNNTSPFRFNQNVKKEDFELNLKMADADYFKTYNLQLVAGRFYEASDTMREFVVNETFLKNEGIINPEDALGKDIILDGKKTTVVGVVRDFHSSSLRSPIPPIGITTFKPAYRVAGIKLQPQAIAASLPAIEKIFNRTFPDYVFEHQFLDETIVTFYDQEQRLSNIFRLFAGIGILISCIGLYGLVLFMSVQRVKEIGVRKVLGASVTNIVLLFFKEFLALVVVAFAIASPVAWYFMHKWLQDFAYRINIGWGVFALASIITIAVVAITMSYQTIKAAMANPVKSLRAE